MGAAKAYGSGGCLGVVSRADRRASNQLRRTDLAAKATNQKTSDSSVKRFCSAPSSNSVADKDGDPTFQAPSDSRGHWWSPPEIRAYTAGQPHWKGGGQSGGMQHRSKLADRPRRDHVPPTSASLMTPTIPPPITRPGNTLAQPRNIPF